MNLEKIPFIGSIVNSRADYRVYDLFIVIGPLIIILAGVLGRTIFTSALAAGYILAFIMYILYKGISS